MIKEGKIKWFSDKKGYGFLSDDVTGADVFVHFSNIRMNGYKSLTTDQKVTYEEHKTTKGLCAKDVTAL